MKTLKYSILALAIGSSCAYADRPIDLDPEIECLTVALYHETRGLSYAGMLSVGAVIMNRVKSNKYPDTVCEVIAQPYQFSYRNQGKPESYLDILGAAAKNPNVYDTKYLEYSLDIAQTSYSGMDRPFGEDVLYYHGTSVDPKWNESLTMVNTIDNHIFWSL